MRADTPVVKMDIFVPEVARDEEGVLDTVECIVQHILYMRDLSPVPIAELRTQLGQNREGITRGMKRYLLKVQKFVDSIDCIMQGLARLLKSNRRLTTVCCFLGTSTTIAREAYYIHFHGSDTVTTITGSIFIDQYRPIRLLTPSPEQMPLD